MQFSTVVPPSQRCRFLLFVFPRYSPTTHLACLFSLTGGCRELSKETDAIETHKNRHNTKIKHVPKPIPRESALPNMNPMFFIMCRALPFLLLFFLAFHHILWRHELVGLFDPPPFLSYLTRTLTRQDEYFLPSRR